MRLVVLVLLAVGGTTLAVGTLSYRRARAELVATTHARLELLGRDVAQGLHRTLMSRVVDSTTWARLETMIALGFGDVDKQIADLLGHALGSAEEWVALVAYDGNGAVVASAGAAALATAAAPVDRTRLGVVDTPGGDRTLLRIDTPVYSSRGAGERLGTLAAFVDPARVLGRLAAERVQTDGVTVAVRVGERTLARLGAGEEASAADDAFRAAAELPAFEDVVAPAMSVVVRQPAHLALASVYELRTTLAWIGVAVVLVSGVLGALVAWRLSDPIRRLTRSVETVTARGRPEPIRVPVRAGGEVGVLADAFESMMTRLAVAQREVIAQSRLALVGEIAASVAHDVRTPLSVLKTSAQLLADPNLPAAEQRDLAAMVSAEVDRLNGVVTRLVDLARPKSVARDRHAIATLVEHVVAVLRPWASARGVAVGVDVDAALAVDADGDELQQALLNLVHNGVQACGTGGRVDVAGRREGDQAVVEVTDTGAGFSDAALAEAFSPFFTTKPDGTGLGLAIVRRVVEAHDGEVGVGNREGSGARVWLRLPLSRATSSSSPR